MPIPPPQDIPRTIGTHAREREVADFMYECWKTGESFCLPRLSCVYIVTKHAVASVGTVAARASADTVGSPRAVGSGSGSKTKYDFE